MNILVQPSHVWDWCLGRSTPIIIIIIIIGFWRSIMSKKHHGSPGGFLCSTLGRDMKWMNILVFLLWKVLEVWQHKSCMYLTTRTCYMTLCLPDTDRFFMVGSHCSHPCLLQLHQIVSAERNINYHLHHHLQHQKYASWNCAGGWWYSPNFLKSSRSRIPMGSSSTKGAKDFIYICGKKTVGFSPSHPSLKIYISTVTLFLSSSHPFPPHIAWAARPPCLLKPRREGKSTRLKNHGDARKTWIDPCIKVQLGNKNMPMMMNLLKICYMLGWTTLVSIGDHKHHHLSAHLFSYVIPLKSTLPGE